MQGCSELSQPSDVFKMVTRALIVSMILPRLTRIKLALSSFLYHISYLGLLFLRDRLNCREIQKYEVYCAAL